MNTITNLIVENTDLTTESDVLIYFRTNLIDYICKREDVVVPEDRKDDTAKFILEFCGEDYISDYILGVYGELEDNIVDGKLDCGDEDPENEEFIEQYFKITVDSSDYEGFGIITSESEVNATLDTTEFTQTQGIVNLSIGTLDDEEEDVDSTQLMDMMTQQEDIDFDLEMELTEAEPEVEAKAEVVQRGRGEKGLGKGGKFREPKDEPEKSSEDEDEPEVEAKDEVEKSSEDEDEPEVEAKAEVEKSSEDEDEPEVEAKAEVEKSSEDEDEPEVEAKAEADEDEPDVEKSCDDEDEPDIEAKKLEERIKSNDVVPITKSKSKSKSKSSKKECTICSKDLSVTNKSGYCKDCMSDDVPCKQCKKTYKRRSFVKRKSDICGRCHKVKSNKSDKQCKICKTGLRKNNKKEMCNKCSKAKLHCKQCEREASRMSLDKHGGICHYCAKPKKVKTIKAPCSDCGKQSYTRKYEEYVYKSYGMCNGCSLKKHETCKCSFCDKLGRKRDIEDRSVHGQCIECYHQNLTSAENMKDPETNMLTCSNKYISIKGYLNILLPKKNDKQFINDIVEKINEGFNVNIIDKDGISFIEEVDKLEVEDYGEAVTQVYKNNYKLRSVKLMLKILNRVD